MATGIETAGLILAAFPILIQGLDIYISSADIVKEMWQYRIALKQFRRAIDMEGCKFDNTWYTLLELAGEDADAAGKPPWSASLEAKLLAHLRSSSVTSFVDACVELNLILEELIRKFKGYEKDKAGYRRMLNAVAIGLSGDYRSSQLTRMRNLNYDLDKLVNGARQARTISAPSKLNVAEHYKRVRWHSMLLYSALKEKLEITCACQASHSVNLQLEMRLVNPKVEDLDLEVTDSPSRFNFIIPVTKQGKVPCQWRGLELEHLPTESLSPSPIMPCVPGDCLQAIKAQGDLVPSLNGRENRLSSSLNQSDCEQEIPTTSKKQRISPSEHTLPVVSEPAPAMRNGGRSVTSALVDNAMLAPPPLSPRSRSTSPRRAPTRAGRVSVNLPPAAQPTLAERIIQSFCSILREAPEIHACLGVLISKENTRYRVWVPKQPFYLSKPAKTVPLAHLLTLPAPPRKARLILGVKLASSVMQLHETEWLRERWGKQDIFFIQEESDQQRDGVLATPLVHRAFTSDSPMPQRSIDHESRVIRCNKSLFSLGIILVELWYWESLESFQTRFGGEGGTPDMAEYCTAVRLIDDLYGDAGDSYGDIVRRCILA